jgi:hypothetical protein
MQKNTTQKHTEDKPMSNKKQTAVEWIGDNIQFDMTYLDVFGLIRQAKEMESKKQQKYDEMLEMLDICKQITNSRQIHDEIEQLIKEAKEL